MVESPGTAFREHQLRKSARWRLIGVLADHRSARALRHDWHGHAVTEMGLLRLRALRARVGDFTHAEPARDYLRDLKTVQRALGVNEPWAAEELHRLVRLGRPEDPIEIGPTGATRCIEIALSPIEYHGQTFEEARLELVADLERVWERHGLPFRAPRREHFERDVGWLARYLLGDTYGQLHVAALESGMDLSEAAIQRGTERMAAVIGLEMPRQQTPS